MMPKLYKYTAIMVAATLIIPALAVQVNAQQMGSTISGKYTNSDWASEITFPQGWAGTAATTNPKEGFSVTVKNTAANSTASIILEGWLKKLGKPDSVADWLHRHTSHEYNCVITANNPETGNPYGVTVDLNGMKATVIVQECSLPGVTGIKSKIYGIETPDKAVVLSFSGTWTLPTSQYFWPNMVAGSQANDYEKYLDTFEGSAKTFKVSWAAPGKEETHTPIESTIPEFPVQVIVATAAIIGLVAILGRTKLIGTNSIKGI